MSKPKAPGPRRGHVFTHATLIDPTWRPSRGQTYAAGPRARMRVTKVTKDRVYFTYADDDGGAIRYMDKAEFARQYGGAR